ncbi:Hypothetical predicted protein [Paramuricea clavata]|uniref:LicD/FKTN/FKRP nucleotidyltransferase domain-containing protein n=1 Tax=Paramuricea clavata TaxID=317549 RepID=A0A7D9E464_PARCT|nr:Hypothetical predicted protein [Paramuricea clavata]
MLIVGFRSQTLAFALSLSFALILDKFIASVTANTSSDNNYKRLINSGMDKYGKPRMRLAVLLRNKILNKLDMPWVMEGGTLLGAWRNGSFILWKDDFDFAMFSENNPKPLIPLILRKIKQLLPSPYKARYVTTYADKIEVYDPRYGEYNLLAPKYKGASFHHCTADLQFYQHVKEKYVPLYYIDPIVKSVYFKDVFPLRSIELEGEMFPAPFNTEGYLKSLYGSLSPNAKFNPKTGFYMK